MTSPRWGQVRASIAFTDAAITFRLRLAADALALVAVTIKQCCRDRRRTSQCRRLARHEAKQDA